MARQGRQAVEDGPTHHRVAYNVRDLRERRGLSQPELSVRLAKAGRPIGVSAVSKIEKGTRRVTVDDLVALALALDVNPNALLLPAQPDGDAATLTPAVSAPWWRAWKWAAGEAPLDAEETDRTRLSELAEWFETTMPHKDSFDLEALIAGEHKARRARHESLVDEVQQAQERYEHDREGDE